MSKIGIVYATKTRHSKKLAEAIGLALDTPAQDFKTRPVFCDIDILFIVGGIYGGEGMPEFLEFLKGLDPASVRRAALLTSCGSGAQKQVSARRILEEKGIEVIDEHVCRGAILFVSAGHPNSRDIIEAQDFAKKIVSPAV
jgi:flavodoxin